MSAVLHAPVMVKEVLAALAPTEGDRIVDATLGAGGYTRAILNAARCEVFAFDRDPSAIERAQDWAAEFSGRLELISRPFAEMTEALAERGVNAIEGAAFDLGVSSMQIDEPARGFSFRADGPLSMRMDRGSPDASDLVNSGSVEDLASILRVYGEERAAGRIARAIVRARTKETIKSTLQLAEIVAAAVPRNHDERIHPATRAFQALRIFVNDELGQITRALAAAERLLRPAGRLVVVSFHSLEDRIVKRFMTDRANPPSVSRHAPGVQSPPATFRLLFQKAQTPGRDEVAANPRARSAKLRAAVRLDAPARSDISAFAPPALALSRNLQDWR